MVKTKSILFAIQWWQSNLVTTDGSPSNKVEQIQLVWMNWIAIWWKPFFLFSFFFPTILVFFSLVFYFFVLLILLAFLFISSPLTFCFFSRMPSPFIIYSFIMLSFFYILLWLLTSLLFCFPFSFIFPLCFSPSLFVPTPQFSLFLLLALSFLLLLSLANIFPLFSLS